MRLFIILIFIPSMIWAKDYQYGWGVQLNEKNKQVKIGGRIQAIAMSDSETETQDFYLRRLRLNVSYKPWDDHKIVYDIRNDSANQKDEGEEGFVIGDAYWQIKFKHPYIKNIRFFRAKVDVSYSQTSSSKNLLTPERAVASEFASDFIVHNRRATNFQINGNFGPLAYQAVVSDGVQSDDLEDTNDNALASITAQKFTYGAKFRYFIFGDARKNHVQDTFYGKNDTFSLGYGVFQNDKITVSNSSGGLSNFSFARTLNNIDLSLSYQNLRLLAEYFEFQGDLIDLTQTTKENILGSSKGGYAQIEYLVTENWAPYVILEEFNRVDTAQTIIQVYGLNYYDLMEARRYGLNYKILDDEHQLYAHIMLNF